MAIVEIGWLVWIASGVVLNGGLRWQRYLPLMLQDILHYGKLKQGEKEGGGGGGGGGGGEGKRTSRTVTAVMSYLLNVPKRWFTHFYAWGFFWNWIVLYWFLSSCAFRQYKYFPFRHAIGPLQPLLSFLTETDLEGECRDGAAQNGGSFSQSLFDTGLVMFLVCLQVSRRLYECLFVSVFSDSKMHILHYVLGMYFYSFLPLTALLHLSGGGRDKHPVTHLFHWYHLVGVVTFFWAWLHQWRCHKILANLRAPKGEGESKTSAYLLPRGDWFEYVSSPHYFAEMLVYAALLLIFAVSNPLSPWWLVLLFTVFVLGISARQVHQWYLKKFEDYPKNRRIVFPFVY